MAKSSSNKRSFFLPTAMVFIIVVFAVFGVRVYWGVPVSDAVTFSNDAGIETKIVTDRTEVDDANGLTDVGGDVTEPSVEAAVIDSDEDIAGQNSVTGIEFDPPVVNVKGQDVPLADLTVTRNADFDRADEVLQNTEFTVQSVLTSTKAAVISGQMDGRILYMPYENGDIFEKGDILVRYECGFEDARVGEIEARLRISERRVQALARLRDTETASDVEYLSARETYKQDQALLEQAKAVQARCVVRAPFDGRVMDKQASAFEASKSGRVLMRVGSIEPLQAELLIPSVWLRWINVGTPVKVYVNESDTTYEATIIRVHGEVDPVSLTAHIVARLNEYQEELLPGMSGRADFEKTNLDLSFGFLGMNLEDR